jgi:hypothetical protein
MVRSTSLRRAVLVLVLLVGMLMPLAGGTAHAGTGLPVECTAAGTVFWQNVGDTTQWQLTGKGSCQGDLEGTYFLDFTGAGSSDTAGLCDGSGFVTNLKINVVGSLTNANTLATKVLNQDWVAPLTTYPIATPFVIHRNDAGTNGAGVFLNHIFAQCLNSPVAQYDLVFVP